MLAVWAYLIVCFKIWSNIQPLQKLFLYLLSCETCTWMVGGKKVEFKEYSSGIKI
jgi:hypothetical protein